MMNVDGKDKHFKVFFQVSHEKCTGPLKAIIRHANLEHSYIIVLLLYIRHTVVLL